ncbi:TM1812 family CRISPR-associated protein [Stygiolobus caldivivus]|uniref:Uncharacterized protein n=1 Tax=Stygiolobus caldivivus TaxID=2824673 RepID=A0A8D5ZGF6_9CREN|nr:TM1812 family CRISPR-associated protein [Stygiolobus caldivivus]BCU70888.1 hypothetical protein KN1_21850 [Stygiolobus caldivivus]
MKTLLVSTWTNINTSEKEYKVVDSRGNETETIVKSYKPSLAEYSFLKEETTDVKILAFLPSFLATNLNELPTSYSILENSLKELVMQRLSLPDMNDEIFVLPSSGTFKSSSNVLSIHDGGIGNFNFLSYLYTYSKLVSEEPEMVMVDLSEDSSYLAYVTYNAVRLAVEDYAFTHKKQLMLVELASDFSNRLFPLRKKVIKDVNLHQYLTSDIKLAKGMNTQGKSELYGIGKALELGFPLALIYLIRETGELISPEEFRKQILEGLQIQKSNGVFSLTASVRASMSAPYYFMGYHFVETNKKIVEGEITLDKLNEFLDYYTGATRALIKREIEIIRKLSELVKDGEYLLDSLIRIGNTRVLDWLEGKVYEGGKVKCDITEEEMVSHAGMGRKFTKVNKEDSVITVKYAEECLDSILSWIKSIGRED